jgi:hypothetical protein
MKKNTQWGKIALTLCALAVPLSAWACEYCGTQFQWLPPQYNGTCAAVPWCNLTYDTVQCIMNEDGEVWVTCVLASGQDVELSFPPCNTDDGCKNLE